MPNAIALLAISVNDANVVVTSVTLVFAMLVALCLVVTGEGKLFDAAAARKKAQQQQTKLPPAPAPADPAAPAAPKPAPLAEGGIPGEVVAAIAAAVYALEGSTATVHSIRRLPGSARASRRGAWGDAGVARDTRPF